MYYDLRFTYRIEAGAGLAKDEEGNNVEAYLQTTHKGCKVAPVMSEERYNEIHEEQRIGLAKALRIDLEMITCISGEEYEANVDDEE